MLGRVTFPFFGLYGASKFALEAMIDSYRYELSRLGVELCLIQPSAYPTGLFAAVQQPADPARTEAYGETGTIPAKMFETFMSLFQGANAPDPHDVAAAIARLVAMPAGERPDRLVVGTAFGADAANAALAPIQQQAIESLGLASLDRDPVRQVG